jgi:hypothetical protein
MFIVTKSSVTIASCSKRGISLSTQLKGGDGELLLTIRSKVGEVDAVARY